ncbi:hypothetical protein, partial [Pantoea agglomerans]|uniref:hypothetical protein n=1 Tax=Enterobacter agglomerans TaxID=549 RepID=UPI00320A3254
DYPVAINQHNHTPALLAEVASLKILARSADKHWLILLTLNPGFAHFCAGRAAPQQLQTDKRSVSRRQWRVFSQW